MMCNNIADGNVRINKRQTVFFAPKFLLFKYKRINLTVQFINYKQIKFVTAKEVIN